METNIYEQQDIDNSPSGFHRDPKLWKKLFDKQKGRCAICGVHQADLGKTLAVDHCHKSNKIRGLLCNSCNVMLGMAKDNPANLLKAIQYLKNKDSKH